MEKRLIRYAIIGVIFFIGLSLGVSYHNNNKSNLQATLNSFENTITDTNDYIPPNPTGNNNANTNEPPEINNNLFTGLAKDGEYVIQKGIDLVLDKSDDFFRFVFGIK